MNIHPELLPLISKDYCCFWCKKQMKRVTEDNDYMCSACSIFIYSFINKISDTVCFYLKELDIYVYYHYDISKCSISFPVVGKWKIYLNWDKKDLPDKETLYRKIKLYTTFL